MGKTPSIVLGCLALVSLTVIYGCSNQVAPAADAETRVPAGPAWFQDRAATSGITFKLGHDRSPLTIRDVMHGGVAATDFDGDGKVDIYFVGDKTGGDGRGTLYRNKGDGTFEDVTANSGLAEPGLYMGCTVGDIDNDGKPEILLTGYGITRLYRNLGGCKFKDVTKGSGLESRSPTDWHSAAGFADLDHDGKLDLYIGKYVLFTKDTIQLCNYGPIKSSCGPIFYDQQFGALYRNRGGFQFQDVTQESGIWRSHGKCLGVTFGDVDNDGLTDMYLANDEMPGDLFINEGRMRFREEALMKGVALASSGAMQGAMGVDFGDFNRDGIMDLFVSTYQFEPDSLYAGSKDSVFRHVSVSTGIDMISRSLVGWGAKFIDLNNDGWLDLPVTNGHIHDNQEKIDPKQSYRQPMLLFMNERGQTFSERSSEAGPAISNAMVGRGLAIADFNDDGLPDMAVTDIEGPARLLINSIPNSGRNWIRIFLQGTTSNRMGLGARVTVVAGEDRWVADATTAGSYLSASDPRLHFGLGDHRKIDRVEVRWPSGKRSIVANPAIATELKVREP